MCVLSAGAEASCGSGLQKWKSEGASGDPQLSALPPDPASSVEGVPWHVRQIGRAVPLEPFVLASSIQFEACQG